MNLLLSGPCGIIRVKGRLKHSSLQYEEKHPIVLPDKMSAYIWTSSTTIDGLTTKASSCRSSIPVCQHRYWFLWSLLGYHRKRYGCIFTFFFTRAVHLEVTDNMDTDFFLLAFRRFVSYRGNSKVIYSDNVSNLKAGQNELKEDWQRLNNTKLVEHLAGIQTQWIFPPQSSPHFGGVWERLIQSWKRALTTVLKDQTVKEEVLRMVFAELAAILKARPLIHLSVDPRDLRPLTASHFMLLRPHPHIPHDVFDASAKVTKSRWIAAQIIVVQYWKRWMKEYVPNLIESTKFVWKPIWVVFMETCVSLVE